MRADGLSALFRKQVSHTEKEVFDASGTGNGDSFEPHAFLLSDCVRLCQDLKLVSCGAVCQQSRMSR